MKQKKNQSLLTVAGFLERKKSMNGMRICGCTLPFTNPDACLTCPNNGGGANTYQPQKNWPTDLAIIPASKPSKKTTETFDKDGKLLSRVVEEYIDRAPTINWGINTVSTGGAVGGTVTAYNGTPS